MVRSVSGATDYNSWVQSLNQRGIKTTSLGKGEANFSDYSNALSESLKQEIVASFDNQADYDLQSKLASLYSSKSVMQSGDIVSTAKANGINVKVEYVPTSYIVDNKQDGHYDKDVTKGSIAVYTFSDGKGGEIKIADANGNGALETEELFMNEILSGVVSDIKPGTSSANVAATQNNMQTQTASLENEMENYASEYQKLIDEQMAQIELDQKKSEARKYINKNYSNIESKDIKEIATSAAQKATDEGITVTEAVKEILGEPIEKEEQKEE